jgi:hypothetical protein
LFPHSELLSHYANNSLNIQVPSWDAVTPFPAPAGPRESRINQQVTSHRPVATDASHSRSRIEKKFADPSCDTPKSRFASSSNGPLSPPAKKEHGKFSGIFDFEHGELPLEHTHDRIPIKPFLDRQASEDKKELGEDFPVTASQAL